MLMLGGGSGSRKCNFFRAQSSLIIEQGFDIFHIFTSRLHEEPGLLRGRQ